MKGKERNGCHIAIPSGNNLIMCLVGDLQLMIYPLTILASELLPLDPSLMVGCLSHHTGSQGHFTELVVSLMLKPDQSSRLP